MFERGRAVSCARGLLGRGRKRLFIAAISSGIKPRLSVHAKNMHAPHAATLNAHDTHTTSSHAGVVQPVGSKSQHCAALSRIDQIFNGICFSASCLRVSREKMPICSLFQQSPAPTALPPSDTRCPDAPRSGPLPSTELAGTQSCGEPAPSSQTHTACLRGVSAPGFYRPMLHGVGGHQHGAHFLRFFSSVFCMAKSLALRKSSTLFTAREYSTAPTNSASCARSPLPSAEYA